MRREEDFDQPVEDGTWVQRLPDAVWSPIVCGILVLIPGVLSIAVGLPWLLPSLGPTAFMHAQTPGSRSTRPYNTIFGHLLGVLAGYFAVWVLGAANAEPAFRTYHLALVRASAGVIAVVLTMLLQLLAHAYHPPAAATTLLIALGTFRPTKEDAASIMAGVSIVAVIGEAFRLARLGELHLRRGRPGRDNR